MKNALLLITDMTAYSEHDHRFDDIVARIEQLIQVFTSHSRHIACIHMNKEPTLAKPLSRYQLPEFQSVGYSALTSPVFAEFLTAEDIRSVYVCGSDISSYVVKTALDLNDWTTPQLGSVCVVGDACYQPPGPMERRYAEAACVLMEAHNIGQTTTDDIVKRFQYQ